MSRIGQRSYAAGAIALLPLSAALMVWISRMLPVGFSRLPARLSKVTPASSCRPSTTSRRCSMPPMARGISALPPRWLFMPDSGMYTPVFDKQPRCNTMSVNAGDVLLYVGGGAINAAFGRALAASGQDIQEYSPWHAEMLAKAMSTPGIPVLSDKSEDGDVVISSAIVPNSSWFDASVPSGLVVASVFKEGRRPHDPKNMGMCYVVGPMGAGAQATSSTLEEFLIAVESVGRGAMLACTALNKAAASSSLDASSSALRWPHIEVLRMCLVSGGVYKHPSVSTEDVGEALLCGLLAEHCEEHSPEVEFAHAGGAFMAARDRLLTGF